MKGKEEEKGEHAPSLPSLLPAPESQTQHEEMLQSLSSNYACVERPVDKFNYHQINTNYTLLGFPLPTLIPQEGEAEHEIPAVSLKAR